MDRSPFPVRRTAALALVLVLALVALASQVVGANPTARIPNPGSNGPNQDLIVVRVHYRDRSELAQLASRLDVWQVNPDVSTFLAGVSTSEYEALLAQGYQVEIDWAKMELIYNGPPRIPGPLGIPGYPCYRTVEETYTSMQDLATARPDLVQLEDFGDSWEKTQPGGLDGYDLLAVRLTNTAIPGPKPRFFLMGAIHAREYVTAETAMRFAEWLVNHYGTDPEATWILDHHEIVVAPHTNPDGRKIAEGGTLWRKNTDNDDGCTSPSLWGTDLNRNYDFKWGFPGSSPYPCDETYRGPSAASEPETQAVQNEVLGLIPDQRGPGDGDPAPITATGILITLHSYSELVLWPWGWTSADAPNSADLQAVGTKLATYNGYTPQQSNDLYPTSGTTDDWSYGQLGNASFTFEMGTWFFQDCSTFENTIYPDNFNALLYAAKIPRTPYTLARGPDARNVATTPMTVTQGVPVTVTALLSDTLTGNQAITGGEVYVDTPPWAGGTPIAMEPDDGQFNTSLEGAHAVLDTAGLSLGRHLIFVRGHDAGDWWGPMSAAFLDVVSDQATPTPTATEAPTDTPTPTDTPIATTTPTLTPTPPTKYLYLPLLLK